MPVPQDQTHAACTFPSQLLEVEALRRPHLLARPGSFSLTSVRTEAATDGARWVLPLGEAGLAALVVGLTEAGLLRIDAPGVDGQPVVYTVTTTG